MPISPSSPLSSTSTGGPDFSAPFLILGDNTTFNPIFYPETVRTRKKRNLDRKSNFCSGEDVSDNGSENREIHVTGPMVGPEKLDFDDLVDSSEAFTMTSAAWSGEVRVSEGEYEGPTGYHPPSDNPVFRYTLDLVSTGRDEGEGAGANGIISFGEADINEGDYGIDSILSGL